MRRVYENLEEDKEEYGYTFLDVSYLLSTGLLEGVPVTYIFEEHMIELQAYLERQGYRCGCSSCNYTQILSALEFQKHAGVTSRDPNDHIYLENGKTLNEVLKHLTGVPPESWHAELEGVTSMKKNSNIYDASRDGISDATICEVNKRSCKVIQTGVGEKTSQEAPSIKFCQLLSEPFLCVETGRGTAGQICSDQHDELSQVSGFELKQTWHEEEQNRVDGMATQSSLSRFTCHLRSELTLPIDTETLNVYQTDSSLHDAWGNGSTPTASCYTKDTSSNNVSQNGVDIMRSPEDSALSNHQLPLDLSFFQKITNEGLPLSTPPVTEARSYQETEIPYPEKKRELENFSPSKRMFTETRQSNELNSQAEEYLSPETPKRQKRETKLLMKNLGVKDLLRTGRLEGLPVMYMKKDRQLGGIIKGELYLCGCSSCNYTEAVCAVKFEMHAGATSKNQNGNIYMQSGISIKELTKKWGNAPQDSRDQLIEELTSCRKNKDKFSGWKGSFQASSINLIKDSENGEENKRTQTIELHCDPHLVKGSPAPATKGSSNAPSCTCFSSEAHTMDSSFNPTLSIDSSVIFLSSATEAIKPGSDISLHSSSSINKSFMLEGETDRERLPDTTEGCDAAPSSINAMADRPQPCIEGNTTSSPCVDVNISSLELSNESSINPGSMHGSSITQKNFMIESRSGMRKRLPTPANLLENDIRSARQTGAAGQGGPKKRTGDLHRVIFTNNIIQDGAELSYCLNGKIILKGKKIGNGILCSHCGEVVSPSMFEDHAGFGKKRQPYRSIYTSSGISIHELTFLLDSQMSVCTICGGGDNLVSCNECAKTFHADCLGLPIIPNADSEWCCFSCQDNFESETASRVESPVVGKQIGLKRVIKYPEDIGCTLCKDSAFEIGEEFGSKSFLFCGQCEKLYHVGCLKDHGICDLQERPLPWFSWLCSVECKEVHRNLQHLVLTSPHDIDASKLSILKKTEERSLTCDYEPKVKWQLLSGVHKTCDNETLFGKATAIFQEAFGPVLEKGCDLIPAMVDGQEMAKQYYGGMYCAVIKIKSEVVSAGLIRVFGRDVAELPLVATSKECQGKGYFKALLSMVEELLIRLKVKFLILPADEETQSIWINKFGFVKMTEERVKQYAEDHWILMFKKKIMLEKELASIL